MQVKPDPSTSIQIFRNLTIEDQQRLDKQRALIEEYLSVNNYNYETIDGKLHLINDLLEYKVFRSDEKYELQCLGVVFGDALLIKLGLNWQIVKEESVEDPCLVLDGTSIVLFPLTAISKRIENNEEVDVFDLFDGFIDTVAEMKRKGY
jgi:hypothetical protein